jgi:hypothetical protein
MYEPFLRDRKSRHDNQCFRGFSPLSAHSAFWLLEVLHAALPTNLSYIHYAEPASQAVHFHGVWQRASSLYTVGLAL